MPNCESLSETFPWTPPRLDSVESAKIDIACRRRLIERVHAFAKVVERDRDPLAVQLAGDGQSLVERLPGNEPGGETPGGLRSFHPLP